MERQQKRWYQMVLGRVKTAGIIWPLSRQITMKRMEFWNDFLRNFENKIQIGKNEYVLKKRLCKSPTGIDLPQMIVERFCLTDGATRNVEYKIIAIFRRN